MKTNLSILFLLLLSPLLKAQTCTLNGSVLDQSGALVPGASVVLSGPGGIQKKAVATNDGAYRFDGLAPGDYSVIASAPQLGMQPAKISLRPGSNTFNLRLTVAAEIQRVTVEESAGPAVSTEASSNASATVISGQDLDALSDDPEDLQADLQALAGPAAGPSGGAIFIDGFSGGQLPPKESIREIRINSNPFSPEYDKLGLGRIEIFTKPGTKKFHGTIGYNIGTDVWNSRNPYATQKAPFLLQESENSFSGPITKRSSFTLDLERQAVDNGSVTNAVTLDPRTLLPGAFTSVLRTPQRHLLVGPHADYQLSGNNTLSVRYLWTRAEIHDGGIGGFDLISRGYHVLNTFNTVQAIETFIHGASVNETRFQFFRHRNDIKANTIAPETQVLGSFNSGGAQTSQGHDIQNSFELQNYTSVLRAKHSWKFGVRLRGQTEDSFSPLNFNGTFTFTGGLAPQLDSNNQPMAGAVMIQIPSIEQYRRTLIFQQLGYTPAAIRALGGGASQFTISSGMPDLAIHQEDVGLFVGDDWRIRPNLTLNLGLRYETQTNIHDRKDLAPRVAFAWAPGASGNRAGKTVLRGGFGMFYDRFALANTLAARRYNGMSQQQYVVTNPDFYPNIPPPSALVGNPGSASIQQVDAHLQAPYIMQVAATVERQLPKHSTLAVTYTNSHGLHVLRSEDINAPLPGTYFPQKPGSGVYPDPGRGPIFLMTSSGLYNQNQMIANVNSRITPGVSLFGYYAINQARSNSDGITTFPANPYNFAGEYGPASTDIRHRFLIGGSINTRWNLRFNPFVTAQTGAPFNVTTGEDLYGTTVYTARPGLATDASKPGVIATHYGILDPNPVAGEPLLPRNYGRGPAQIAVNLRVGKTWGFGPDRESSGAVSSRNAGASAGPVLAVPTRGVFSNPNTSRRYNLTISMSGRNVLNRNNPGPIIGSISSPLFGRANQTAQTPNGEGFSEAASNRRLELQIRFTF